MESAVRARRFCFTLERWLFQDERVWIIRAAIGKCIIEQLKNFPEAGLIGGDVHRQTSSQ